MSVVRIITDDLDGMVAFYETITGLTAVRPAPVFVEFISPRATLAIGHRKTVPLFGEGSVKAAANRSVILSSRACDHRLRLGLRSRPQRHGATGRSCCETLRATSSTCSRALPRRPSNAFPGGPPSPIDLASAVSTTFGPTPIATGRFRLGGHSRLKRLFGSPR